MVWQQPIGSEYVSSESQEKIGWDAIWGWNAGNILRKMEDGMRSRRSFLEKAGHVCAGAIAGTAVALAQTPGTEALAGQKFLLIGLSGEKRQAESIMALAVDVRLQKGCSRGWNMQLQGTDVSSF